MLQHKKIQKECVNINKDNELTNWKKKESKNTKWESQKCTGKRAKKAETYFCKFFNKSKTGQKLLNVGILPRTLQIPPLYIKPLDKVSDEHGGPTRC